MCGKVKCICLLPLEHIEGPTAIAIRVLKTLSLIRSLQHGESEIYRWLSGSNQLCSKMSYCRGHRNKGDRGIKVDVPDFHGRLHLEDFHRSFTSKI